MKIFPLAILLIIFSCASKKETQADRTVRAFLVSFEKSLAQNDSIVLSHFGSGQKSEFFLPAIKLLQNQEKTIQCTAKFDQAIISLGERGLQVEIPVTIHNPTDSEETSIKLKLTQHKGQYYISNFDGEDFFNKCHYLIYNAQMAKNQADWKAMITKYANKAKEFASRFDSVAWFTNYDNKTYFYVVNNNESESVSDKTKMGLMDDKGNSIVPIEFDLIGTIGIAMKNVIEVRRDNKVGYYSITGTELIPPSFDWIIPYTLDTRVKALVRNDTTNGWVDFDYKYHAGFIDMKAKAFIQGFEFLSTKITLNSKDNALCIQPHPEYLPSGTIFPPSYLVNFGLLSSQIDGFTIKGFDFGPSSTESMETKSFNIFDLSNDIKLLITNFKSHYLGGRYEFYNHNRITLVNTKQDTLNTSEISGGESVILKRLTETLIEAKVTDTDWYEPISNVLNYPTYSYFEFNGTKMAPKQSNRSWPMTEFVKLDSSYFAGKFQYYDIDTQKMDSTSFVTTQFLEEVRRDILANIGYKFTESFIQDQLQYRKWYNPIHETYQEAYAASNEIDKHNLDFIETLIGPYSPQTDLQ